jgi:hypothetical protein
MEMLEPGIDNRANDHDILLELYNDMQWVKEILKTQARQRWEVTLAAIVAMIAGIGSLILFLVSM